MHKLIRFDWAIKKILRDKSNFDILEGLLTALFQEDITIISLLESEGNQDDDSDKFNRVDILVENEKKELIIIEVQVRSEYDYFHRIAYGVSKLITDYMQKGQPFGELKKVISISIAYFNLGVGNDYLYYGSTRFVGVNQNDELKLTQNQEDIFGTEYVHKIFPEYYLIRVGKFNNEVKKAIDEWIYMFKNSEVKQEFTAKNIQLASEKLRVLKLNEQEKKAYDRYMENRSYEASMMWSSKEEGRKEGKILGEIETLKSILENNSLPEDFINRTKDKLKTLTKQLEEFKNQ